MQLDLGSLWRHEQLRRIEENRRAEEAGRPSPPTAPPGFLAVWWRRTVDRGARRRRPAPAPAPVLAAPAPAPVLEIDLTDAPPAVVPIEGQTPG
jgi:hypothetical protein